ncbi:MAG: malonyl-ACP O-methyltransferase BioC [Thermodesulfobacteriota bacterium]
MPDKHLVRLHFSANAGNYDLYAHVQKKMASTLMEFAGLANPAEIDTPSAILDVGSGTGYLTELLLERFPDVRVTAVDIAPGMIDLAKRKFSGRRIKFICADAEEMILGEKYDLIASNASFQWFNDTQKTLEKLFSSLTDKGTMCFSTFGSQTFSELHQAYTKAMQNLKLEGHARPGQRFYTLDELQKICEPLVRPYREMKCVEEFEYIYFDSVKDFFTSVRKIGANNSNKEYIHKNPSLIKELINIYETDFREGDKIKVTYHCLYFVLRKSA